MGKRGLAFDKFGFHPALAVIVLWKVFKDRAIELLHVDLVPLQEKGRLRFVYRYDDNVGGLDIGDGLKGSFVPGELFLFGLLRILFLNAVGFSSGQHCKIISFIRFKRIPEALLPDRI